MSLLRAWLLVGLSGWLLSWGSVSAQQSDDDTAPRWNILFFFADDWGRFAGHYAAIDGRPGPNDLLQTPNMDPGATKAWLMANEEGSPDFYERAFGRRPGEELYDLRRDPDQLDNVAGEPAYAQVRAAIAEQLLAELEAAGDPRVTGDGLTFERSPFTDVSGTANRYADMMPEPGIAEE